ncbi:DNA transposition protein [Herbaspirillum lusitanum]|uniref:AAA family ATPase n=1 Tax=Herbaspirillum lusitanum TaxID=213312 RepID=UPI00223882B6|nr:AAA family ATPase [Herbaspirillum lusitanum]MCW5300886.1 DNA transposition protein [Herbaspirillum lusitanum]
MATAPKQAAPLTVPTTWAESYDAADVDAAKRIVVWLNDKEMTRSWLARLARISPSTMSQILSGKYPTSPSRQLSEMEAAIEAHETRSSVATIPFVTTSIYQMTALVCDRARKYANFGILTGAVGVGKTAGLKQYQGQNEHTIIVEANPNMTAGVLLTELLTALGAPCPNSMDKKFSAVVEALKDTTRLLIIDEAETMMPQCLHYLRRIRDKANVGIVLAGTDRLMQLIKPLRGQFDQIRSRVGFWPAAIQRAERADIDAIAQAALADQGELAPDVLEAIWHYCQGSVRMLVENLIPALRDYALHKYDISPEVIDQTAEKVLFMPPRRTV